ncbi:uncharacterized protein LOC131627751 [Vicia villosa]|uniref:uncharacterized protein LOC131627751 n=1 Tax=Vicia villosa TaxID=3911 RepID=UPI00273C4F5E|nr:uncharacterized protein LOC131627751 [Vicia villosa]
MEYLHRCLKKLHGNTIFKFHPKCNKLGITSICFADDLMLFTRGDVGSVQAMMDTVNQFSTATGLKASPTKCRVYFGGVDETVQQRILSITGFQIGNLPFKYLGVPLMCRSLTVNMCKPLIDRITSKITHWTSKLLSYAGKQQLVKSVLFAITNYWMQVFQLPKCVTKHIEAICRSFVWSGKAEISRKAPVSWKKICEPKNAGGLNITSLNEWNLATLGKLLWNIQAKADKMWVKWINIYYLKEQDFFVWQPKSDCSILMKNLVACRDIITQSGYWQAVLQNGFYKTSKMYMSLRGEKEPVPWRKIGFQNLARPRAQFLIWMAFMDRLNTKTRIQQFGIHTDLRCAFCPEQETINHIFFECRWTRSVWTQMLVWLGYHHVPGNWQYEKQWITMETNKKGWRRQLLKAATTELMYAIWQNRNAIVFAQGTREDHVLERVKFIIYTRCARHRTLTTHFDENTLYVE